MSKHVFFIGPLGKEGGMIGGDSLKNLHLTRRLQKLSVPLRVIDTNACRQSLWKTLSAIMQMMLHRKSKFIISASSAGAYKLLKAMRFLGVSDIIYWVVGGDFPNLLISNVLSIKPYANAKHIIVEGKRMEETLRICGLGNVMTLPNFKPIEFVPPKKRTDASLPVRFVFLSRIAEDKGCSYINKAAGILNKKGYASSYTIDYYGSIADVYKDRFTQETDALPNVEYKGFLQLLDKSNYEVLASYDAMLFPTFFYGEGFAGIFIDAFIAGLPVIATDWSLNSEIVRDGETGIIVENRNAEKLAAAMESLILNPEKVIEMSKACQSECMNYDTCHVVTLDLLKRLDLT